MKLDLPQALILAAVGFGGYYLWESGRVPAAPQAKIDTSQANNPTAPVNSTKATLPSGSKNPYPLEKGSKGDLVKLLQQHLGVTVDGYFGTQTENALQQRHGVSKIYSADGLKNILGNQILATTSLPTAPAQVGLPGRPTATPPAPPATTYPPGVWADLNRVFRAIWQNKLGYRDVWVLKPIIDRSTVQGTLGAMTDADLKTFIVRYNRAYRFNRIEDTDRPTPTLYSDVMRINRISGSAIDALQQRIKKLS